MIIILSSGCLYFENNDEKEIKHANPSDLKVNIILDENTINSEININIKLINCLIGIGGINGCQKYCPLYEPK